MKLSEKYRTPDVLYRSSKLYHDLSGDHFLIIANTVIGVQFLMGQQKSGRRYKTLIRLGATYELLCRSARKQINWYFGMPVVVAGISSIFGVRASLHWFPV